MKRRRVVINKVEKRFASIFQQWKEEKLNVVQEEAL
jgi:hypothetical protein